MDYYSGVKESFAVISDGTLVFAPTIIGEHWADYDPGHLTVYFEKGYGMLLKRLEHFRKMERSLTSREERELKFMLEALIDAKSGIYGESKQ